MLTLFLIGMEGPIVDLHPKTENFLEVAPHKPISCAVAKISSQKS
jgi:hypothetical protein